MRIALVTTEFPSEDNFDGGLSNYLLRLSISLIRLGHEPIVFVESTKNEVIKFKGIQVVRVKRRFFLWFWLVNILSLFQLRKAFLWVLKSYNLNKAVKQFHKNKEIDIIQYASSQAIGILRPKYIPSVIRISSYQKMIDAAYGKDLDNFHNKQKQWLEEYTFKKSNALFGPSTMVGAIIEKMANKKVNIIETPFLFSNEPFDYSVLAKTKVENNINKYFLFFGTLGLLKGVKDIGLIIASLLRENPDYHFIFIGKDAGIGKKSSIVYLKESANDLKNKVICINKLPHSQLYPFIEKANLVILPSRIDNFPNVCIEAMAFGKTVIGTYETSFEQLIDNGINGFLCKHSDPNSILETTRNVLRLSNKELELIGIKAKERIALLEPEIVVQKLLTMYRAIIHQFQ